MLVALAVAGCSKDSAPTNNAPAKPETPIPAAQPPQPKKPIDTRPLPQLERDPGNSSGAPQLGLSIGGLGIDVPNSIVAAADGSLYVAGYFDASIEAGAAGKLMPTPPDPPKPDEPKRSGRPADAYLAHVGADGKLIWIKRWGDKRDDVARAVAVHGQVIAVAGNFLDRLDIDDHIGQHPGSGSDDLYVATFDSAGKVRWIWTIGGIDSDGANAIAAAPDGGWYVGGSFRKTITINGVEYASKGQTDALLIKLDAAGKAEWVRQYGGMYDDTIMNLASDPRGNIYIQGNFRDTVSWGGKPLVSAGNADSDVVVAKYDANGDHIWSQRFGNDQDESAGGLALDKAGNLTIVGSFHRAISFGPGDDHASNGQTDAYIARFDNAGTLQWAHTYGGDRGDVAWGIAADDAGNTIATGWFENKIDFGKTTVGTLTSRGNKDVFVIKHDPMGAVMWVQTWGDRDHDQGRAVTVDAKGSPWVAGLYRFTLSAVKPPLESVRAEGDRIPKPDTFVLKLAR